MGMGVYWGVLVLMIEAHFIFLTLKYCLLSMITVMGSTQLHDQMIESLLRSPIDFFSRTPSGVLTNKFTTDLGVLDNSLALTLIEAIEGPILLIVAIFNMVQIDAFLAIPAGILSMVAVVFFLYARPVIIACKHLDLQEKGPIFHEFNETVNNLIQIRICNLRNVKIKDFSEMIDKSIKSSIGF
jgi:ABC-type multidrug transport system fused ATPase/permease subunit